MCLRLSLPNRVCDAFLARRNLTGLELRGPLTAAPQSFADLPGLKYL